NTRLPPGAELPHDRGVREQITSLVAGGPHVSNLILASNTGKAVFGIDIPVSRNGAVAYDLAIVIQPSIFDQIFAEQRLPESWIGIIVDRGGILVRRSYKGEETTGQEVLPPFKAHLAQPA